MEIRVKRAYEPPAKNDGERLLVDWIWPRGVSREQLQLAAWMKEIAPSSALRRWFGHDPAKWDEFKRRYGRELAERPGEVAELLARSRKGVVTLVYAASDERHNNALALKEFLEKSAADSD